MSRRFGVCSLFLFLCALSSAVPAFSHGFNANWVQIVRTETGRYRVIIRYTHNEVGEYREAYAEFEKKDEAIKAYQDLAQGADFFLGDVGKSIHFHNPPEKNKPY